MRRTVAGMGLTMKRKSIPLKTKLAAALCHMVRPNDDGKLERIIAYEQAKRLTEDQVLSKFHFDHWPVRKEMGGGDEHYNLMPRPVAEHQKKTSKIDIPAIAKSKRLEKKQQEFREKILAKAGRKEAQSEAAYNRPVRSKPRFKSRPLPGTKASGIKKKFNGDVERR